MKVYLLSETVLQLLCPATSKLHPGSHRDEVQWCWFQAFPPARGGVHTPGLQMVLTWLHSFGVEMAFVQLAEKGAGLTDSCLHRPV